MWVFVTRVAINSTSHELFDSLWWAVLTKEHAIERAIGHYTVPYKLLLSKFSAGNHFWHQVFEDPVFWISNSYKISKVCYKILESGKVSPGGLEHLEEVVVLKEVEVAFRVKVGVLWVLCVNVSTGCAAIWLTLMIFLYSQSFWSYYILCWISCYELLLVDINLDIFLF